MAKKRGKRFRLLIYERMWRKWGLLSLLVALASVALWLLAPRIRFLPSSLRMLILVPALASFAIFAYTFMARRMAWVQCRPNHLRIQTPIYPLIISYARIKVARPTEFSHVFDPSKEKPARRNWLRPYWGMTTVVVEISQFPIKKEWLRLWFSSYMFSPEATGFVFLVDDWMTLSRQLDDFRNNWELRRAARRKQPTY
ncbi:MAG: hypothetical protein JXA14_04120 [Anaerolineae bacterium]|nr:hypothetical protein [Anaerolineae bacterium]